EIGVAGSVDDVDAGALPLQRGGIVQNGNAALALQVVGVHRALGHLLVLAIGAGLLQQAVDEGGLAVVDVGDDGDVTKVHGSSSGRAWWMRDLTGKPGPTFPDRALKPGILARDDASSNRHPVPSILFEHDLRANAYRLCPEGKTGIHFSGSCSGGVFPPKRKP